MRPSILALLFLAGCPASSSPKAPAPAAPVKSQPSALTSDTELAGLAEFLGQIPEGQEQAYGFASREEFEKLEVERPWRVFQVDAARLARGDFSAAASPTDELRFPLSIEGRFRALATVVVQDGRRQIVDFGATGLAGDLGRLEQERATRKQEVTRVLLRVPALRVDFLGLGAARVEELAYVPAESARALLGMEPTPRTLGALLPLLKERLPSLPAATP